MQTTDGEVQIPATYSEVMRSPHKAEWLQSMQKELDSHTKAGTWVLVPAATVPHGRKIVGSTWVWALKRNSLGEITRWKSRLVAQGFSQIEGLD